MKNARIHESRGETGSTRTPRDRRVPWGVHCRPGSGVPHDSMPPRPGRHHRALCNFSYRLFQHFFHSSSLWPSLRFCSLPAPPDLCRKNDSRGLQTTGHLVVSARLVVKKKIGLKSLAVNDFLIRGCPFSSVKFLSFFWSLKLRFLN